MDGDVMVQIPVSAAVAEALRDPLKVKAVGQVVSDMVSRDDPNLLQMMIAQFRAEARANGLTDELVDAELAAHKAERRR